MKHPIGMLLAAVTFVGSTVTAGAEPMFLSKSFPRCTSCHFSPTGGGLLNNTGRVMSHVRLPTFPAADPTAADSLDDEQGFLWGALGDSLGPVSLGVALRPSHLRFDVAGRTFDRNLLMQADVQAAYRSGGVTLYGVVDRRADTSGASVGSYEHWIAYDAGGGVSVRAGRFMPAYGVRFADHTSFNRRGLGFDQRDQVYGVEISRAAGRSFLQVSLAPGRAESILDDRRTRALAGSARLQFDLTARAVLVASGVYRAASDVAPRSGSGGVALGVSPTSRLSVWTQLDRQLTDTQEASPSWVFVNETAFEAIPGVWLKLSPQYQATSDRRGGDVGRLAMAVAWIPRTHWNVNLSYYRDRNYLLKLPIRTLLAQLHLFL